MPRRYAFTGAPGAGKTVLLQTLRDRGWSVVDEAATDVIADLQADGVAEPWRSPDFADRIVRVQRARADAADADVTLFDRSPLCTVALARHLGHPVSAELAAEAEHAAGFLAPQVFFVRPLGFVTATEARRISYDESLVFEAVHEQVYREYGFTLVDLPPAPVADRVVMVERALR